MLKKLQLILFIIFLSNNYALADELPRCYFRATLPVIQLIRVTGGNITSTINPTTGILSAPLNPTFTITTNDPSTQNLTMSATTDTQSSTANAVFNTTSAKYIILTNSNNLPPTTALDNIKSGSPSTSLNPNAIAYQIQDPTTATGLTVAYNSTNKNWNLTLNKRGSTSTTITTPASTPLSGTFSVLDSAGAYQATIILSFN